MHLFKGVCSATALYGMLYLISSFLFCSIPCPQFLVLPDFCMTGSELHPQTLLKRWAKQVHSQAQDTSNNTVINAVHDRLTQQLKNIQHERHKFFCLYENEGQTNRFLIGWFIIWFISWDIHSQGFSWFLDLTSGTAETVFFFFFVQQLFSLKNYFHFYFLLQAPVRLGNARKKPFDAQNILLKTGFLHAL